MPGYDTATDISGEHSLCTCTQVRRNVRKSDVVYSSKKKKKKKNCDRSDRVWHLTLRSGAFIARRPPGMHVLTVVLAKGVISQVCRCFCKRYAFLRKVWRTIVPNRKACESLFSNSLLRLRGFRLVRRERQYKYRVWYSVKPLVVARVHVAGRFPADEQLTAS